jgi:biofilm protein TabA
MIHDRIQSLKRYAVPKTDAILKFIAEHDCVNLPDGEMEIEGRELFVRIMSYTPKPAAENRFEHHRHYADVQYVILGAEIMQTTSNQNLEPLTEYDSKGDYQFFKAPAKISSFLVKTGECAIFYPTEAHRTTCLHENHQGHVKKLVFKVKINT